MGLLQYLGDINQRKKMITPEIIEEVTKRLVNVYQPETIYLFGSYAWGHPDEESDLDLLIVVRTSDEKSHKRIIPGLHVLWDLNISKDLLVYTQEEFDVRVVDPTSFLHKIKNKGKVIYARS
jgi:Nucleotidyltransferase domain.